MAFTMTVAELIDADTSGLLGKHASWERVPLAEIATILNGAPFDSALFSATEGMPLIRIRDVTTGQTSTYYTGPYEDEYLIEQGDLLVGMDGDFNSGFWSSRLALLNQRVCKIAPVESHYDKQLLAFALPGYLAAINANTPSVTVKHLSSKTIAEIDLPLPPRAEQTRIVAKLEELLSDLDAGVAELKAAQKKLAQYRQSLLKAAVEGALTAQWREAQRAQHTPTETGAELLARILQERRARWEAKQLAKFAEQGKTPPKDWQKKYPEPVQPDTSNLPELPQGWVWASVAQLGEVTTGFTPPTTDPTNFGGSIPFIKPTDLDAGYAVVSSREFLSDKGVSAGRKLPAKSILVTCIGATIGKTGLTRLPCATNQQINAISAEESGALPEFLYWMIVSGFGQAQIIGNASATTLPILNKSKFEKIPLPLPSLREQHEIVSRIEVEAERISRQLGAIDLALKQSAAQRQNILRAAFAGELVPQDPKDEPASHLLERIRAERAAQAASKKPRGRKPKVSCA